MDLGVCRVFSLHRLLGPLHLDNSKRVFLRSEFEEFRVLFLT